MANTPTPRSFSQILGQMLRTFAAKTGVQKFSVGNPILSLFETTAESQLRASQDIFAVESSHDLDRATGVTLEQIAKQEKVPRIVADYASGYVTIGDSSFSKQQSAIYSGTSTVIVGTTDVNINLVDWPATGSIYLGRGTASYEGPIAYGSLTQHPSYTTLHLSSPVTKFHNQGESVILAQGGNRQVGAGTIVAIPQANNTTAVQYSLEAAITLLDGEDSLSNVRVIATQKGTVGNVSGGAISSFPSLPFSTATVTNPEAFDNGVDQESEDSWRERIRAARNSRTKGTDLAILNGIKNLKASDESSMLTSAALIHQKGLPSVLYIDDGSGYEEKTTGVPVESVISSAIGGEQYFELNHPPVAKAFLVSKGVSPFALYNGSSISFVVGGITYTHTFSEEDFGDIEAASAYEVVASINSNPTIGFAARTANNGTAVVVYARTEGQDDIEVVEGGTNDILLFPTGNYQTLCLYKNDNLLCKDGRKAIYRSQLQPDWGVLVGNQTLTIIVDRATSITITITDQSFIDAATGYSKVGRNSVAAWGKVLTRAIPGITATEDGGYIALTSNKGYSDDASIEIVSGTLVTSKMFFVGSATGKTSDYSLNRNRGQIKLVTPLVAGDKLSVGTYYTQPFVESSTFTSTTFLTDKDVWFAIDGNASQVNHGLVLGTPVAVATNSITDWARRVTLTSAGCFSNVRVNDWAILTDSAFGSSLRGAYKVVECNADTIKFDKASSLMARAGHQALALAPTADPSNVLVCGGFVRCTTGITLFTPASFRSYITDQVEIFNPTTNEVETAPSLKNPRAFHTATLANDGKVIVSGGIYLGPILKTIEIFNGAFWGYSSKQLTVGVWGHRAIKLNDGKILICGGWTDDTYTATAKGYIYDPVADTLVVIPDMGTARGGFGILKLADGRVMVAGGKDGVNSLDTCEIYDPALNLWAGIAPLTDARAETNLVQSGVDTVLALGSSLIESDVLTHEVYTISTNTWASAALVTPFKSGEVVATQNGTIIAISGGTNVPLYWDGATWAAAVADPYANCDERYWMKPVVLNVIGGLDNKIVMVGGLSSYNTETTGYYKTLDVTAAPATWDIPDSFSMVATPLNEGGVSIVRAGAFVRKATITAGTYTADTLSATINTQIDQLTASVYKTKTVRVSTNSLASDGAIGVVGTSIPSIMPITDVVQKDGKGKASIRSAKGEIGTPVFSLTELAGKLQWGAAGLSIITPTLDGDQVVVAAHNQYRAIAGGITPRQSSITNEVRAPKSIIDLFAPMITFDVGTSFENEVTPKDRVYVASGLLFAPEDVLQVEVDSTNFNVNMAFKVKPADNSYTNAPVIIADSGAKLRTFFGDSYIFDDFAVLMNARGLAFEADAARTFIIRSKQFGPGGENTRVRLASPEAADEDVKVALGLTNGANSNVLIRLPSGSSIPQPLRETTKVGIAYTGVGANGYGTVVAAVGFPAIAAVYNNATQKVTLTLELPLSVTNSGLAVNNILWIQSTDATLTSRRIKLSAIGPVVGNTQTVVFDDNLGAVPFVIAAPFGTVTFDSVGEVLLAGLAQYDYFRVEEPALADLVGKTLPISVTHPQYLECGSNDAVLVPQTALVWFSLASVDNLKWFANPKPTSAQVVAAVNALTRAPVTLKNIRGVGGGNINLPTCDEIGDPSYWYTLHDGINWVNTTTLPVLPDLQYALEFKKAISSALTGDVDWQSEEIYLSPVTGERIVDWLRTPCISGLFTKADIQLTDNVIQLASKSLGDTGSVRVVGGTANLTTAPVKGNATYDGISGFVVNVTDNSVEGFRGNQWCWLENSERLYKTVFSGATSLTSFTADGIMTLNSLVYAVRSTATAAGLLFEKQGGLVAIINTGIGGNMTFSGVEEGDWVRITAPTAASPLSDISSANTGIFRVVAGPVASTSPLFGGAIWIENPNAINETVSCNITCYTGDSVMPGDTVNINTDIWGANNRGTWTVERVGCPTITAPDFSSPLSLKLTGKTPSPATNMPVLGQASFVTVQEVTPRKMIKQLIDIIPSETEGYSTLRFRNHLQYQKVNEAAGTIITAIDKLGFNTDPVYGVDGYNYDRGLLGECNKVIFGDSSDEIQYPGIISADREIHLSGAIIRRIRVSLILRIKNLRYTKDIINRVRSNIASIIRRSEVGKPIAASTISEAASGVPGVVSVIVTYPAEKEGEDLIKLQPYEKAMIFDLERDIQVAILDSNDTR